MSDILYNPFDWYWFVGIDSDRVFSSKTNAYVDVTAPAFQAWVARGNSPSAIDTMDNLAAVLADVGVPPFAPVTPLQARKALRQMGMIDTVNATVAAASADVKDAWEFASEVRRDDPMLQALQAQLGLTQAQVDALFVLASTL